MPKKIEYTITVDLEYAQEAWRNWNEDQEKEDKVRWSSVKACFDDDEMLGEFLSNGGEVNWDSTFGTVEVDEYIPWLCETHGETYE